MLCWWIIITNRIIGNTLSIVYIHPSISFRVSGYLHQTSELRVISVTRTCIRNIVIFPRCHPTRALPWDITLRHLLDEEHNTPLPSDILPQYCHGYNTWSCFRNLIRLINIFQVFGSLQLSCVVVEFVVLFIQPLTIDTNVKNIPLLLLNINVDNEVIPIFHLELVLTWYHRWVFLIHWAFLRVRRSAVWRQLGATA